MFVPNSLRLLDVAATAEWTVAVEEDAKEWVRSQEGHIVRVVGGFICMYICGDNFSALSS